MTLASFSQLLLLAAIWGGSFMFMRIGAPVFGPAALIALRVAIAAVFLWAVARWLKRRPIARQHWRYLLVIGLFNSAVPFLLFAYAAQTLSASMLSILNAAAPIFGALIAAVWLRTRVTAAQIAGLLIGMAGVAVLVSGGVRLSGEGIWLAVCAGLLAPFCYGVAATYAKRVAAKLDAFDNAHGSMWTSTVLVVPLAAVTSVPHTPAPGHWWAVAALGVVCTGAAYLLYFRLVDRVGPLRALTVTFLIPVFGVLWGVVFLDEQIGWHTAAGAVMVLLGTALSNQLFSKKRVASAR